MPDTMQNTTISIHLNGEACETAAATLAELLQDRGVRTGGWVAVARNGAVVPRAAWDSTALDPGDDVEVVTALQGG